MGESGQGCLRPRWTRLRRCVQQAVERVGDQVQIRAHSFGEHGSGGGEARIITAERERRAGPWEGDNHGKFSQDVSSGIHRPHLQFTIIPTLQREEQLLPCNLSTTKSHSSLRTERLKMRRSEERSSDLASRGRRGIQERIILLLVELLSCRRLTS
jgi:hypothetical protein